jgi:Protein of unknown function (DUF2911)
MKKKIFIGLGLLVVVFIGWSVYGLFFATPKSPTTTTTFSFQGTDFSVRYSRPSKKGRLIFGEEKDDALQPYGKYWRLGANAATELTVSKNFTFGGKPVNAGTYRMYAVPGANAFQVVLNSEVGVNLGAARDADHALDVAQVELPVQPQSNETEMFTITFASDSAGVNMDFVWDKVLVRVPISVSDNK